VGTLNSADLPLPSYLELACPPQASLGEALGILSWAVGLDTTEDAHGPEYATLPVSKRPVARKLLPRRLLSMIQTPDLIIEWEDIQSDLMIITQAMPGLSTEPEVTFPFPLPSKIELSLITGNVETKGTELGDFIFSILKMKRDDGSLFGYRESLPKFMKAFKNLDYVPNGKLVSAASVSLVDTAISIVHILSPRHVLVFGTQQFCQEYRKVFASPQHLCVDIKNYNEATTSIIEFVREVNKVD